MLRLLGIPVSDDDARSLVATLLVEGTPDALTAAAMITKGVERNLITVGLSRAERTAVLACLEALPDGLVDPLGREQPPMPALMPRLTTTPPTRPRPARTRRHRRRILRRRQRRVPRTPVQPPLELNHPSLEPLVRLDQLTHPQQLRDRRLPITVKDRPSLSPLHTSIFAAPTRVPPQRG